MNDPRCGIGRPSALLCDHLSTIGKVKLKVASRISDFLNAGEVERHARRTFFLAF